MRITREIRGRNYLGHHISNREPSDIAHLAKRVLLDEQWAWGTTVQEYIGDLHRAAQHPSARLAVFAARGQRYAGIISPNPVPEGRLGVRSESLLWVVYNSDHGTITTGYQVSSVTSIDLPENIRWLR